MISTKLIINNMFALRFVPSHILHPPKRSPEPKQFSIILIRIHMPGGCSEGLRANYEWTNLENIWRKTKGRMHHVRELSVRELSMSRPEWRIPCSECGSQIGAKHLFVVSGTWLRRWSHLHSVGCTSGALNERLNASRFCDNGCYGWMGECLKKDGINE